MLVGPRMTQAAAARSGNVVKSPLVSECRAVVSAGVVAERRGLAFTGLNPHSSAQTAALSQPNDCVIVAADAMPKSLGVMTSFPDWSCTTWKTSADRKSGRLGRSSGW